MIPYQRRAGLAKTILQLVRHLGLIVLLNSGCTMAESGTTSTTDHHNSSSWQWIPEAEHPCTVRRQFPSRRRARQYFRATGGLVPSLFPEPIVIRRRDDGAQTLENDNDDVNAKFRNMTEQHNLLAWFGPNFPVTLSSSNALSEHRRNTTLAQYIHETTITTRETTPNQRSNESWYLFGETYSPAWRDLLYPHYVRPPCVTCHHEDQVALAFGMGNRGSGVQWHVHGPGFSETLHGRKHWILYPPNHHSNNNTLHYNFDKDQSSRQWMEYVYPTVLVKPVECTLHPGDLIYFPNHWWHATINLDPYTAFISTFTTEHTTTTSNTNSVGMLPSSLQTRVDDDDDDDALFLPETTREEL